MQLDELTLELLKGNPELRKRYEDVLEEELKLRAFTIKNNLSLLKIKMAGEKKAKKQLKQERY